MQGNVETFLSQQVIRDTESIIFPMTIKMWNIVNAQNLNVLI